MKYSCMSRLLLARPHNIGRSNAHMIRNMPQATGGWAGADPSQRSDCTLALFSKVPLFARKVLLFIACRRSILFRAEINFRSAAKFNQVNSPPTIVYTYRSCHGCDQSQDILDAGSKKTSWGSTAVLPLRTSPGYLYIICIDRVTHVSCCNHPILSRKACSLVALPPTPRGRRVSRAGTSTAGVYCLIALCVSPAK